MTILKGLLPSQNYSGTRSPRSSSNNSKADPSLSMSPIYDCDGSASSLHLLAHISKTLVDAKYQCVCAPAWHDMIIVPFVTMHFLGVNSNQLPIDKVLNFIKSILISLLTSSHITDFVLPLHLYSDSSPLLLLWLFIFALTFTPYSSSDSSSLLSLLLLTLTLTLHLCSCSCSLPLFWLFIFALTFTPYSFSDSSSLLLLLLFIFIVPSLIFLLSSSPWYYSDPLFHYQILSYHHVSVIVSFL